MSFGYNFLFEDILLKFGLYRAMIIDDGLKACVFFEDSSASIS